MSSFAQIPNKFRQSAFLKLDIELRKARTRRPEIHLHPAPAHHHHPARHDEDRPCLPETQTG